MGTNPGAATLSGLVTWPANSGVAEFSGLSLQKHTDDTTASGTGADGIYTLEASTATLDPGTTSGFTVLGYTPDQIRAAYGINDLSLTGSGETIAIVVVQNDPSILSDVNAFDAAFNLSSYGPASSFLTVYDQNSNVIDPTSTSVPTDPSGKNEAEEALDVEWAHAIAPGARIDVVEANSGIVYDPTTGTVGDAMIAVKAAETLPHVSVVSQSYGTSESKLETLASLGGLSLSDLVKYADTNYYSTPGVTFVASSGDDGAPGDYPAFSPNVLAVGGTTLGLNPDNSYAGEIGWSGSGGGFSSAEPEPAYQVGVVPGDTAAKRATPDVAFDADPNTAVAVYDSYNNGPSPWGKGNGTSLGAPCWAALIALVNQGRDAAGAGRLNASSPTQALQAIYSLPGADFHDVTRGNNGYPAGPNYDLVTGRGSPVANLLVPDLINYPKPIRFSVGALPNGTENATYNQPITTTGGVGSTTLTLTITSGAFPTGLSTVSGTNSLLIQGTPTAIGTVRFNVTATDGAGDSVTQSYTLTVNPVITFSPPSIPAGVVGAAYRQTISAGGGAGTKTVSWTVTSGAIPAGLLLAASPGDPATLAITGTPTASGTASLNVMADDTAGDSATATYTLIVNQGGGSGPGSGATAPTVTSVSPTSGPATGGTSVTILGTNLGGVRVVDFGANAATVLSDSGTEIVASSPVGTAESVDVTVTTVAGTSATSLADRFTYEPATTFVPPLVTVTSVGAITRKHLLTQITIGFSGAVNAGEADSPATYRVTIAGKKGSFTARGAQVLKLKSAVYSPATSTVTLTLKKPSSLAPPIQVLVNGEPPAGLQDSFGRLIDGDRNGQPGGNAIAVIVRGGATIGAVRPAAMEDSMPGLRRHLADERGHRTVGGHSVALVRDRRLPRGAEPLDDVVEDRRQEDAEERHAEHAAEDRRAQRPPHLGAGALGDHQRHDAEDEGERGHQDRPQPQPAGLEGRLAPRHARLLALLGELDDQDRVLARQADQDHEADLGEEAHVHAGQVHADERAEQAHRHHQDHRQRQLPALVLRRQHQEDEDHRQREDAGRRVALPGAACRPARSSRRPSTAAIPGRRSPASARSPGPSWCPAPGCR